MLPGDRLVCVFVESLAVGSRFTAWPLHVTIVPWFRLALSSDDVLMGLQKVTASIHPFTVVMDDDARFGRHKQKLVNLVSLPSPLNSVEQAVRKFLKASGAWLVDETTKRRLPYRPHVTAQGNEGLQRSAGFWCEKLYLIEQLGSAKTVAGIVGLTQ